VGGLKVTITHVWVPIMISQPTCVQQYDPDAIAILHDVSTVSAVYLQMHDPFHYQKATQEADE
jgi:hypothetical protein